MFRHVRWLSTVLMVPVLAFVVAASSHLALRCSLTGTLMVEPCCPDGAEGEQPPAHDSIAARSCCERLVVSAGKLPATFSAGEEPLARAGLFVVAWAWPAPSRPLAPTVRPSCEQVSRSGWPPSISAPSFLLKRSFLI
ncbi:MAG TPA: hypothetical protein VGP07_20895 [Polyangia bacterium]